MAVSTGMKPDPYLELCTDLNFKWIKDLNIRSEANRGESKECTLTRTGKDFLKRALILQANN